MLKGEGYEPVCHVSQVLFPLSVNPLSIVDISKTRKEKKPCRDASKEGVQLGHHEVVGLRVVEDTRDEDVVHGSLRLDAQLEGDISEPVGPEDAVAVDHDAPALKAAFLFGELALDWEPEQAVAEEPGAVEEMHRSNLKATVERFV